MAAQMAKCFALRHEERVVSPITNARLDCQMHCYCNESQATLTLLLHRGLGKGEVRENVSHFLGYGLISFSLMVVVKHSD